MDPFTHGLSVNSTKSHSLGSRRSLPVNSAKVGLRMRTSSGLRQSLILLPVPVQNEKQQEPSSIFLLLKIAARRDFDAIRKKHNGQPAPLKLPLLPA